MTVFHSPIKRAPHYTVRYGPIRPLRRSAEIMQGKEEERESPKERVVCHVVVAFTLGTFDNKRA